MKKCDKFLKFGWDCRRDFHLSGPCALVPCWWNVVEHYRSWRFKHRKPKPTWHISQEDWYRPGGQ